MDLYSTTVFAEDISSWVAYKILDVFLTPVWFLFVLIGRGDWYFNIGEDGEGISGEINT